MYKYLYKYIAIIDAKTAVLCALCVLVTWFCYTFGIAYNLNITLFSIAVIFPLVFTIREAFKRRDNALKFLSVFKAAMGSVYYSLSQCKKLDREKRLEAEALLERVSAEFFDCLGSDTTECTRPGAAVNDVFGFVDRNKELIPNNLLSRIIRFLQDVNEGIENTISLKLHGTPISMRAYCLVFVFIFPFVFAPTIVFHLPEAPALLSYTLSILHGFILISLYNVQAQMENPFDQVGLDDINLGEFHFPAPPYFTNPPEPVMTEPAEEPTLVSSPRVPTEPARSSAVGAAPAEAAPASTAAVTASATAATALGEAAPDSAQPP